MTLGQKQELFARLLPRLLDRAHELGFTVRLGETWRPPEWADEMQRRGLSGVGRRSNHCNKLAIDLNLFRDGRFLTSTEAHRPLGEWWEQQHGLCRWGGRFNDGNHYSVEHNGVK